MARTATLFACAAVLAWSPYFAAEFSIPKLMILSIGLLAVSLLVMAGAPVDFSRSIAVTGGFFFLTAAISAAFSADPYISVVGRYNSYSMGLMGLVIALCYHIAAAS